MQGLDAAEMLHIWELGLNRPNWYRGLLLLAPCFPEMRFSELASVSLGERNRALLQLWERLFGQRFDAFVECPFCGEPLEFSVTTRELLDGAPAVSAERVHMDWNGLAIQYRLLDTRDLAAVEHHLELSAAAAALARRSLVEAIADGKPIPPAAMPPDSIEALAAELARNEPLADPRIMLACASSEDHVWRASLDVVNLLWTQVDRKSKRLLNDVQVLARAYGWQEAEILSMSEGRREYYLESVDA